MRTKGGPRAAKREPRGAHQQPIGAKTCQEGQEADHENHGKGWISKVAPPRGHRAKIEIGGDAKMIISKIM